MQGQEFKIKTKIDRKVYFLLSISLYTLLATFFIFMLINNSELQVFFL